MSSDFKYSFSELFFIWFSPSISTSIHYFDSDITLTTTSRLYLHLFQPGLIFLSLISYAIYSPYDWAKDTKVSISEITIQCYSWNIQELISSGSYRLWPWFRFTSKMQGPEQWLSQPVASPFSWSPTSMGTVVLVWHQRWSCQNKGGSSVLDSEFSTNISHLEIC